MPTKEKSVITVLLYEFVEQDWILVTLQQNRRISWLNQFDITFF